MTNQQPGTLHKHDQAQSKNRKPSCLERASSVVQRFLEHTFYRLGHTIGKYPLPTLAVCLLCTGVFGAGISFFYQEAQPGNLWVPADSVAQEHRQWIDDNYPPDYLRFESMIVEAENVLDPSVLGAVYGFEVVDVQSHGLPFDLGSASFLLQFLRYISPVINFKILEIDQKVKAIDEGDGVTWDNVCARLGSECWSNSVLELWSFNSSIISELDTDTIINVVNSVEISPVYQVQFEVTRYLGGLTRDSSGRIVGAKAAYLLYVLKSNASIQEELAEGNKRSRLFEEGFMQVGEEGHSVLKAVYYRTERSQLDVGMGAIFGDLNLLFAGIVVIVVFVAIALGKFNMVHHRVFLAISGVLCVGFSALVSIGIASYAGVFFGPLHNILPFLLLGIGVDDMFVIVQAWEMTKAQTEDLPMPERIGKMMKNAGVSITVTSLTDILAFGIGATTKIPALRSFCIYASIGIFAVYLLQATFFVACITLDNRRASNHRNACCCCYVHKNYEPNKCSQREFVQGFFDRMLGGVLTKKPVKVLVILLAAALFGPAVYGVTQLKQDFNPDWFIPSDTYLYDYRQADEEFFSDASSIPAAVYLGQVDYYEAFPKLVKLHTDMESMDIVQSGSVQSWYYFYDVWLQSSGLNVSSSAKFYEHLHTFLYGEPSTGQPSPGAAFLRDIVFNTSNITQPRYILMSKVHFQHISLEDAAAEIAAMEEMRDLISALNLEDVFPYSFFYLVWEANKVIRSELFRNLGLAFLSVFIMTLLLIAHPWTCILVSACVIGTLVDVGGLIYYWGLTIDTVTSINLILAVGLAVDYAAHIGHAFMTVKGSRNERTMSTLSRMGPAVFYGGFSTFLAFVLLAGSNSYVFIVFFRVFFGVIMFGLFHGLIFLPVILSLVGPAPYLAEEEMEKDSDSTAHGQFDDIQNANGVSAHDPIFQGSMLGAGTINSGFLGDGTPNVKHPQQPTNSHNAKSPSKEPVPWMFYQETPKPTRTASATATQGHRWPGNTAHTYMQPQHWYAYQPYFVPMSHTTQGYWTMPQISGGGYGNQPMRGHVAQKSDGKKRKNTVKH